jgi:hypothetical protein
MIMLQALRIILLKMLGDKIPRILIVTPLRRRKFEPIVNRLLYRQVVFDERNTHGRSSLKQSLTQTGDSCFGE